MSMSFLIVPAVWLLKSASYWGIFRWRTVAATIMDCLVIAGSPLLLSILPLPAFLALPASIGLAIYLTMHYTGVDLIPDGLLIPLTVELLFLGAFFVAREMGVI